MATHGGAAARPGARLVRAWKGVQDPDERVFAYLREHADKFLTEDHVAAQVGIGKRRTRKIIHELAADGKILAVETVSSARWGRPKMMFCAHRHIGLDDQLRQMEIFGPRVKGPDIRTDRELSPPIVTPIQTDGFDS